MAFLDDLGKKITSVGQTTVQKAKDMTDIARINSLIAEEEKKTNNNYYQIGKLYVAKHSNDYEDEFMVMITSIKESEEKIKNYKEQIQETKGMVRCEACGELVSNSIAFCSLCGAKMPKYQSTLDENSVRCPYCNVSVPKNMRFCTNCGKTIAENVPVPGGPSVDFPVVNPEPVQSFTVCPSCGAENDSGSGFCSQCGKPLKNITIPSTAEETNLDATQIIQTVNICKVCGVELESGTAFCPECGTKV